MAETKKEEVNIEEFYIKLEEFKDCCIGSKSQVSGGGVEELRLKLIEQFKALQDAFHEEMYDFHHTELSLARSNIEVNEGLNQQTARQTSFEKLVNDFITTTKKAKPLKKNNTSNPGQNNRDYVADLKKMYESLFSHLMACKQYSKCNSSKALSQP